MNPLLNFIRNNWTNIWGYGRDTDDGESRMYLAIPVSVIEKQFEMKIDEIRSGEFNGA